MTPAEYAAKLRKIAQEARDAAGRHVETAAENRRKAAGFTHSASLCEADAVRKSAEAAGWDEIAVAVESGVISTDIGRVLVETRSAFAEAHDDLLAATRALPVFGVAKPVTELSYTQAQLDGDDCALCGRVLAPGQATGEYGDHDGDPLYAHLSCIADAETEEFEREGDVIDAADRAQNPERSGWADPAVRAAVRQTIAATPAPVGVWDDPDDATEAGAR